MIIAIDGPAGSGKTSVAKLLAKKLGIFYLDTGATYRCLTYVAIEKGLDLFDEQLLAELAKNLDLVIKCDKVYLGGLDVSDKIRTPIIDKNISRVVSFPEVRKVMVQLQRKIAAKGDYVVEGRDITTVVFPGSKYKFYLDARPEVRAVRRHKELTGKGVNISFDEVKEDLERRDYADKNRKSGPLILSHDASSIDTSNLTIEGVVDVLAKHVRSKKDHQ